MYSKLIVGLFTVAALFLMIPFGKKVIDSKKDQTTKIEKNENAVEVKVPEVKSQLPVSEPAKIATVKNKLILEAKNTLVLRGPVTGESVGKLIKEMGTMSRKLAKTDVIYLVLDTPGGSVFDGMELIDFMEAIPQEVKTVTLFAASMGFQIAENNPGERLISRNGTLMSHRASGGVDGQFDGELETRYKMVKRKIDYLDTVVSNRVGLDFNSYKEKIVKEWWIHGFDALDQKVADKMVLISCGDSLEGTDSIEFRTMFGPVTVVFDKCPLIREPVEVKFDQVRQDAKPYVKSIFDEMFADRIKFVKGYILTNKFYKIFTQ